MANKGALALAQVAYDAGFRGQALTNMVALGLAESGGDPNSLNDNPKTGDYSVGYWQINYFGQLAPGRTKLFGPPDNLRGTDPVGAEAHNNAAAAFQLSGGGQNLNPWQADFNNGNYHKNLPAAQDAVNTLLGGATMPGSVGSVPGTFPTTELAPNATLVSASSGSNPCLIRLPSIVGIGGSCLLSTSQARAIGGVLLIAAGGMVAGLGITLLVAATGLDKTNVAGAIPGPWGAVANVAKSATPTARKAKREQDETDEDAEHAQKVIAERDNEGQQRRAKQAFKGQSTSLDDDF